MVFCALAALHIFGTSWAIVWLSSRNMLNWSCCTYPIAVKIRVSSVFPFTFQTLWCCTDWETFGEIDNIKDENWSEMFKDITYRLPFFSCSILHPMKTAFLTGFWESSPKTNNYSPQVFSIFFHTHSLSWVAWQGSCSRRLKVCFFKLNLTRGDYCHLFSFVWKMLRGSSDVVLHVQNLCSHDKFMFVTVILHSGFPISVMFFEIWDDRTLVSFQFRKEDIDSLFLTVHLGCPKRLALFTNLTLLIFICRLWRYVKTMDTFWIGKADLVLPGCSLEVTCSVPIFKDAYFFCIALLDLPLPCFLFHYAS